MLTIGIDPGIKNLGLAWSRDQVTIQTKNLNPSNSKTWADFCQGLDVLMEIQPGEEGVLVVERFVSYEDRLTANSEDILMLIGAITCHFQAKGFTTKLVRAIDWKTWLVSMLAKTRDFKNPGVNGSLDKKFSLAAFECLWETKVPTDHEADAGCLCFISGGGK